MSDNEFTRLLRRARAGDESAQTQIYLEFGPLVRRVIRRRLRDLKIDRAVEPDDVFDSVFVGLWKPGALRDIQDAQHFMNYVDKTARHKAQQIPRNLVRVPRCGSEVLSGVDNRIAESELDGVEFNEELTRACAMLSGRERLICLLHNSGYTWEDIGSRLRINPDAARMTHARAEARIRSESLGRG